MGDAALGLDILLLSGSNATERRVEDTGNAEEPYSPALTIGIVFGLAMFTFLGVLNHFIIPRYCIHNNKRSSKKAEEEEFPPPKRDIEEGVGNAGFERVSLSSQGATTTSTTPSKRGGTTQSENKDVLDSGAPTATDRQTSILNELYVDEQTKKRESIASFPDLEQINASQNQEEELHSSPNQEKRKAEEESDEENSVEKTETEAEDSEKTDQGRRSSGSSVETNGGPEEKVGEMKNIAGSIVRSSSSSSDSSIIEVISAKNVEEKEKGSNVVSVSEEKQSPVEVKPKMIVGVSIEDDGIVPYISSDDENSISSVSSAEVLQLEELGISADASMQNKEQRKEKKYFVNMETPKN